MITLEQLRDNYLLPVLGTVPFKLNIFIDTGDYKEAERNRNVITEYINGVFSLVQSEVKKIGGGLTAVALVTSLKFLFPCGDEPDLDGGFSDVTAFRTALSEAFSENQKLSVETGGITYVGGVAYSLPSAGTRAIRQGVGDSIEYTCTITFGYLENALNASDVHIEIDGTEIAYTSFTFTRKPNISADLFARSRTGESFGYAENAPFMIDLETPALTDSEFSSAVAQHILGTTDVNAPHNVSVSFGAVTARTQTMILGECSAGGAGVSNIVYKVSLLPYAAEEITGG